MRAVSQISRAELPVSSSQEKLRRRRGNVRRIFAFLSFPASRLPAGIERTPGMIGSLEGRVITVVGGDDQQIAVFLTACSFELGVEVLQRPAVSSTAVAECVEVHEVGEYEYAALGHQVDGFVHSVRVRRNRMRFRDAPAGEDV